jgi:hypothetical protein
MAPIPPNREVELFRSQWHTDVGYAYTVLESRN